MGGKRAGQGKYLYLCAAVLMVLAFEGCTAFCPPPPAAALPPARPAAEPHRHLERVQVLLDRGDFEGALRASQEALAAAPNGPFADELLFDQALIYAHHANPRKDFQKSLGLLTRLVKEYPGSPLVDEASIWAGVLEAFEKAKQVDLEIERKLKGIR